MKQESSPVVVVDSSFVAELLIGSGSPDFPVNDIWRTWEDFGTRVTSLELLGFEIPNVLYKYERRNLLSPDETDDLLLRFLRLPIALYDYRAIATRSLEIARFYGMGKTYDPSFVALADLLGCDLWTTDASLYRTVHHHFPNVRVPGIGD